MVMSVETPEYAAMMHRMIRAHGRRAGAADPEDLAELVELRSTLDSAIHTAVNGLRNAGVSWARIGAALGVTRQAAQQLYGKTVSSQD